MYCQWNDKRTCEVCGWHFPHDHLPLPKTRCPHPATCIANAAPTNIPMRQPAVPASDKPVRDKPAVRSLPPPDPHITALLHEAAEKLEIAWDEAKHYAVALQRWAKAGYPVRDQAEVTRIDKICQSNECKKYANGRCTVCGCRVNTSRIPLLNKIKMATEQCPIGRW